jgi:hypothetical protein
MDDFRQGLGTYYVWREFADVVPMWSLVSTFSHQLSTPELDFVFLMHPTMMLFRRP